MKTHDCSKTRVGIGVSKGRNANAKSQERHVANRLYGSMDSREAVFVEELGAAYRQATGRDKLDGSIDPGREPVDVILLADLSHGLGAGGSAYSKKKSVSEIAGFLAFLALSQNDNIGLVAFSDVVDLYVPPRSGRPHVMGMIHDLMGLETHDCKADIPGALDFVNQVAPRKAIVFVISDLKPKGDVQAVIAELKNRFPVEDSRHSMVAISAKYNQVTQPFQAGWNNHLKSV